MLKVHSYIPKFFVKYVTFVFCFVYAFLATKNITAKLRGDHIVATSRLRDITNKYIFVTPMFRYLVKSHCKIFL